MARAAILDDSGLVVNVILIDARADPAEFGAVPCPDEVNPGWRREGDRFEPPKAADPQPEEPALPTVPTSVPIWKFAWQAAAESIIGREDALAWSARGVVPDVLETKVADQIADPERRFGLMLQLASLVTVERADPLVETLGGLFGKTSAGLDQFFRDADARSVAA